MQQPGNFMMQQPKKRSMLVTTLDGQQVVRYKPMEPPKVKFALNWNVMVEIVQFLERNEMLNLQTCSRRFYNQIVPFTLMRRPGLQPWPTWLWNNYLYKTPFDGQQVLQRLRSDGPLLKNGEEAAIINKQAFQRIVDLYQLVMGSKNANIRLVRAYCKKGELFKKYKLLVAENENEGIISSEIHRNLSLIENYEGQIIRIVNEEVDQDYIFFHGMGKLIFKNDCIFEGQFRFGKVKGFAIFCKTYPYLGNKESSEYQRFLASERIEETIFIGYLNGLDFENNNIKEIV